MRRRARVFGHPVHLILIVFPLGLLATSFFFDVAWLATGGSELAVVAKWLILAGIAGGGLAAVFGMVDWLAIAPGTEARRVGALHGGGNALVAVLFAVSWLLRQRVVDPPPLALAISAAGVVLIVMTGWLGSEVARRMGTPASGSGTNEKDAGRRPASL